MLTDVNSKHGELDLSNIQRFIFNVFLFSIPWFIIPLPWDFTERGKSLFFLILFVIIFCLEISKWIWSGKLSLVKSPLDKGISLVMISIILSYLFAQDTWVAMWGIDGRLSNGLITALSVFSMFFIFRNFIISKEQVIRSIEYLLFGITFMVLLSILSFLKIEIFSIIPMYKEVFTVGLPLTYSFSTILLVSLSSIFLILFLLFSYLQKRQYTKLWYLVLMLLINTLGISLYSVNQGLGIILLFLLTITPFIFFFYLRLEKKNRWIAITVIAIALFTLLASILLQNTSFRKSIFNDSLDIVAPLQLGNDISWKVSTSTLISSISRGLFGLGNDSFSIAYSFFKPLSQDVIAVGGISFTDASNELFTILTNRGVFGFASWIFLAYLVIKLIMEDIKTKKVGLESSYIILDFLSLFIVLCSLVMPFNLLSYILLILSFMFTVLYRSLDKEGDTFVLKFWALDTGKDIVKNMNNVNWIFSAILFSISLFILVKYSSYTISTVYLLKADSYISQQSKKYEDTTPTLDQRETFLNSTLDYYEKALRFDSESPVVSRKLGLISLEKLGLITEQYSQTTDQTKRDSLLYDAASLKNRAIDYTRDAINTSPYTYDNWSSRAVVFIGFLGVGLQDYSADAIYVLDKCTELKPLDYESYYKKGQVYMVTKEYDKALSSLTEALKINGQHIQSLLLSANINKEKGNTAVYVSFLEAAKKILDLKGQTNTDQYKEIVESISKSSVEDSSDSNDTTEENSSSEDNKETETNTNDSQTESTE